MPDSLTARLAAVKDRSTCRITTRGRRTGRPHTRTIWFVVEDTVLYLATLSCLQHNLRIQAHYDRLIQRANRPLPKMPTAAKCLCWHG